MRGCVLLGGRRALSRRNAFPIFGSKRGTMILVLFLPQSTHSENVALTSSGPSTERRITSNYRTWWLKNTLAKKGFGFSAPFDSESVLNLE
jgi:hypothetical protein